MSKYTYKTHQADQVLERSLTTVWGEGLRPIGWLVVLRDVTEEYQLAQERELLTETLVHDLRSPIGAVLGSLEVISSERFQQGKVAGEDMVLRAVDIAQRGAQRVLGLVDSVLDIARWEAGEMELKLSAMKLGELVNEVLAEYQPQAWDYGLDVSSSIPDDLPEISADRDKVNRVLSNLLDNAMKFTPTGGKIHLFANADPGGMLQVYVRDTGPGIPEAYREKIFERFCQVPGQQGRRRGSGLGLTFCRLAVEAHGGKIWVEEAQGWGSVFVFSLPIN
jgi:signal transduction histidine kinase